MGMAMGQQMASQMAQAMNGGAQQTAVPNQGAAAGGTAPNFCPNCGTKTNGANFCPNCGQKLV